MSASERVDFAVFQAIESERAIDTFPSEIVVRMESFTMSFPRSIYHESADLPAQWLFRLTGVIGKEILTPLFPARCGEFFLMIPRSQCTKQLSKGF